MEHMPQTGIPKCGIFNRQTHFLFIFIIDSKILRGGINFNFVSIFNEIISALAQFFCRPFVCKVYSSEVEISVSCCPISREYGICYSFACEIVLEKVNSCALNYMHLAETKCHTIPSQLP